VTCQQHPIADAHPSDLNQIVFPGQDYNNARIMDFQDVSHWQQNKLDRKYNSRMGWSDISISLKGPIVEDLRAHFAQRWNFIYFEKYDVRKDSRYHPIDFSPSRAGIIGHPYRPDGEGRGVQGEGQYHHFRERMRQQYESARGMIMNEGEQLRHRMYSYDQRPSQQYPSGPLGGVHIQVMRSCTKWSHGVPLEHSIADAYIDTIKNSQHFVYIENQFFITATSDEQKPVQNRIGAAIVERIIRAARNGEAYHMIVNIPAIPGFAGDLKADESLGTRAIMEFQYNSINRGGYSIMEKIAQAGIDPMQYIRFYNLRNYDRINAGSTMQQVEQQAGVSYDDARQGHDQKFAQVLDSPEYGQEYADPTSNLGAYDKYQQAAQSVRGGSELASGRWDSVAECYMLHGPDIRTVPWDGDAQSELDAFVSEELYIHSKLLIADDRVVIVGSANLNDRSQLGSHDSEIAVLIEDQKEIDSSMAGRPWKAKAFAASLRRQVFRKHLGLLPAQDMQRPDANFLPVGHDPNVYDWGSSEDRAVTDPLSEEFASLWKGTAATNTSAFRKVFHPVPDDSVTTWQEYDAFFERFFNPEEVKKASAEQKGDGKDGAGVDASKPSTWKYGHVVAENFAAAPDEALSLVKEELSKVRGTLVEMPLLFLKEEDIAKEGLTLNGLTEEVYT
jgi:phospholipase D1/2